MAKKRRSSQDDGDRNGPSLEQIICNRLDLARRELSTLRQLPSRVTLAYLADCLTRKQLKNLERCFQTKGADDYFWNRFWELVSLDDD